jgi:hypothetical protein
LASDSLRPHYLQFVALPPKVGYSARQNYEFMPKGMLQIKGHNLTPRS